MTNTRYVITQYIKDAEGNINEVKSFDESKRPSDKNKNARKPSRIKKQRALIMEKIAKQEEEQKQKQEQEQGRQQ